MSHANALLPLLNDLMTPYVLFEDEYEEIAKKKFFLCEFIFSSNVLYFVLKEEVLVDIV